MKYIGFITEHDNNNYSISFEEFRNSLVDVPEAEISQFLDSLSTGHVLFATMGFFEDLENQKEISPLIYYTDGASIWPSYLSYYVRSRNKMPSTCLGQRMLTVNSLGISNKNQIIKDFISSFKVDE